MQDSLCAVLIADLDQFLGHLTESIILRYFRKLIRSSGSHTSERLQKSFPGIQQPALGSASQAWHQSGHFYCIGMVWGRVNAHKATILNVRHKLAPAPAIAGAGEGNVLYIIFLMRQGYNLPGFR